MISTRLYDVQDTEMSTAGSSDGYPVINVGVTPSGSILSSCALQLPHEIIDDIVLHISGFTNEVLRRRTLSSCCMLSKAWYRAAISSLYKSPRLTNKNFDKFVRTICPPVNSHVRQVGLEDFILHLDMGHLAYESSKSLTARLLRRTRASLESFVAPAVSFSVASLAPLSKCQNLRSLDLSRDFYDIDLAQLLRAIKDLPLLSSLSLPKSAMRRGLQLKPASSEASSWPLSLCHLQINDWLPQRIRDWMELIDSWPSCLRSIAFENCVDWTPFHTLALDEVIAEHIHALRISMRGAEDGFPIEILLSAFPNLQYLAIPVPFRVPQPTTASIGLTVKSDQLKHLVFRSLPGSMQPKRVLTTTFLTACMEANSVLMKIDVPEAYMRLEDGSMEDLDKIEEMMDARAADDRQAAGIYLIEP